MSATIENYVVNFFKNNPVDKSWDLVSELRNKFYLDTVEAYSYVSRYLSKKWEIQ